MHEPRIRLQKILENLDRERPLILLPPPGVGTLDLAQTVFPPEEVVVIARNRAYVDRLQEENPGVQIETAAGFVKKDAARWSLVVVLGADLLGTPHNKIGKAVMFARRRGAQVLCLSRDPGRPEKLFGVAKVLGVHLRAFGRYESFREKFLLLTGPTFNPWVTGVRTDALPELWVRTKTFLTDLSKVPEEVIE